MFAPVTAGNLPLFLALVLIPAVVYLEAMHHCIGKNPGGDGMSAGAWASLMLIPPLAFLVVITYLDDGKDSYFT